MALLGDRQPHQASASLIRFACLLLLVACGASTAAVAEHNGVVHLWINGAGALWEIVNKGQVERALSEDILEAIHEYPTKVVATPHRLSKIESAESDTPNTMSMGLDVDIDITGLSIEASDLRDAIIKSDLPNLNNLVNETFRQKVKAFPSFPTTELFIDNATIAMSQPIKFWELYLSISNLLNPKEDVFQAPDEVLRYMPSDLQDALKADASHYQIMPTSMWTNSTDAYISYTVYAAPADQIPADRILTPKEVQGRLLGSRLLYFGRELYNKINSDERFSELRDKTAEYRLYTPYALMHTYLRPPIKPFPTFPTTEVFIDNATLAIDQLVELWELYLSIANPLIPKESMFQAPDEVLRYMRSDLQDALKADESHYQIMPTSMWTTSTDTYISYTVYAAPTDQIPADKRLTPKEVHDRLLGSILRSFGHEVFLTIMMDKKFMDLRVRITEIGLRWLDELEATTLVVPIRSFSTFPTTELFIDNATLAIGQPVEFWESYLSISKPLIPKESVFQVPYEVLRYMRSDLQSALYADVSHYQIMPTSMWTTSTGTYISYTVYAAPADQTPADKRLTPKRFMTG